MRRGCRPWPPLRSGTRCVLNQRVHLPVDGPPVAACVATHPSTIFCRPCGNRPNQDLDVGRTSLLRSGGHLDDIQALASKSWLGGSLGILTRLCSRELEALPSLGLACFIMARGHHFSAKMCHDKNMSHTNMSYGVATISRLLKIIRLFRECRSLL